MIDHVLLNTEAQVNAVIQDSHLAPQVAAFFDEQTFTASYVVSDRATKRAAIIDSVWNFDHASGRTSFKSADAIIAHVEANGLTVDWILETHAHADHLSAAPYLQQKLGGELGIGREIVTVQGVFGKIFNEGTEFARDGSQFDRLLDDGDTLMIVERLRGRQDAFERQFWRAAQCGHVPRHQLDRRGISIKVAKLPLIDQIEVV